MPTRLAVACATALVTIVSLAQPAEPTAAQLDWLAKLFDLVVFLDETTATRTLTAAQAE